MTGKLRIGLDSVKYVQSSIEIFSADGIFLSEVEIQCVEDDSNRNISA